MCVEVPWSTLIVRMHNLVYVDSKTNQVQISGLYLLICAGLPDYQRVFGKKKKEAFYSFHGVLCFVRLYVGVCVKLSQFRENSKQICN